MEMKEKPPEEKERMYLVSLKVTPGLNGKIVNLMAYDGGYKNVGWGTEGIPTQRKNLGGGFTGTTEFDIKGSENTEYVSRTYKPRENSKISVTITKDGNTITIATNDPTLGPKFEELARNQLKATTPKKQR